MSDIVGDDWAIEPGARHAANAFGALSELRALSARSVTAALLGIAALLGLGAIAAATLEARAIAPALPVAALPGFPLPIAASPVATRPSSERAAPVWTDVVKPMEIFNLEAADLPRDPRTYGARLISGGGRRDVIGLGILGGEGPAMRLALYRPGSERVVVTPIFADLARLAAEAGLSITRSGLPDLMSTRFGAFEVVAIGVVKGSMIQSCSGFRLTRDAPAFAIMGLACGGRIASRARLACLLDRIDLTAGGGDRPLVDFFAASELRRDKACAGMRLGPDIVHGPHGDDQPATPLKNRRRH